MSHVQVPTLLKSVFAMNAAYRKIMTDFQENVSFSRNQKLQKSSFGLGKRLFRTFNFIQYFSPLEKQNKINWISVSSSVEECGLSGQGVTLSPL